MSIHKLNMTFTKKDIRSVTMRIDAGDGAHMDFAYSLAPDDYMLRYTIFSAGMNGILAPSTR